MNIVKEREIGTIEQINVTPIKKYQFIAGKLIPFWIIGLFELVFGLGICRVVFGVPFEGSFLILFFISGFYLLILQALGLIISTITDTQHQAIFISWFIMVLCILLGGLFTPISSMPLWAQNITLANPIRHYIDALRQIILKGSSFKDLTMQLSIIVSFAVVGISIAILSYRKSSD